MKIPNEAIMGSGENTLLIGSSPVAGTNCWSAAGDAGYPFNPAVKIAGNQLDTGSDAV